MQVPPSPWQLSGVMQMLSAASSQSDLAFNCAWQAGDAAPTAAQSCLHSSTVSMKGFGHIFSASFSQTLLHESTAAELDPAGSLLLPHAAKQMASTAATNHSALRSIVFRAPLPRILGARSRAAR